MNDRSGEGRLSPIWQAVLLLTVAYVVLVYGIGYLLPLLGVNSAPVPSSVISQYMLTVLVGVLLYMSSDEERWQRFKAPLHSTLVRSDRKGLRIGLLVAIPPLVGWMTYQNVKPSYGAPPTLRSVHPAPPTSLEFRGRTMELEGLDNPLRSTGDLASHIRDGAAVYVINCVPCHGDQLDGKGHFAEGFSPLPADFTSGGTISQLTESYVFWRIAKGGPGLPREGAPWNSAMPAWENILTENEIWSAILYLYDRTGWSPRTWEEEAHVAEEGEG